MNSASMRAERSGGPAEPCSDCPASGGLWASLIQQAQQGPSVTAGFAYWPSQNTAICPTASYLLLVSALVLC